MRRFFLFLLCIVLVTMLMTLLLSGCGPKIGSDVAAVVNGEKITKNDVDREVKMIPFKIPLLRRAGFAVEEQRKLVLLNLIEETLIKQEAEKNGIKVTDREIQDRYKLFRTGRDRKTFVEELNRMGMDERTLLKQIEEKVISEKLFGKVIKPRKVTEQEMKDYYNKNRTRYKDLTYERAKVLIFPTLSSEKQAEAQKAWLDQVKARSDIRLYSW